MNHNILPDNHYSLKIIPEIQEICQPLFKKYEINIFTYMRCFNDGSIYTLMTHRDTYQHHLKCEYPLSPRIPEKILSSKFHYLVLPELQDGYDQAMRDHKNLFGLTSALYMYERFENYFDFYSYNSTEGHPGSINNLLNNIQEFDKFKYIFKQQARKIITISNENKIIIPLHMRPNFCGTNIPTINKKPSFTQHVLTIDNKNTYLTPEN